MFLCKNIYQIADKTFVIHCFFNNHVNHKHVNKTACKTKLANPLQQWRHCLKSIRTVSLPGFLICQLNTFNHF